MSKKEDTKCWIRVLVFVYEFVSQDGRMMENSAKQEKTENLIYIRSEHPAFWAYPSLPNGISSDVPEFCWCSFQRSSSFQDLQHLQHLHPFQELLCFDWPQIGNFRAAFGRGCEGLCGWWRLSPSINHSLPSAPKKHLTPNKKPTNDRSTRPNLGKKRLGKLSQNGLYREVLLPSGAGQAVAAAQLQVDTEDRPLDRFRLRFGGFLTL